MTLHSEVLLSGSAQGEVLRFDAPISFWGGIDPTSALVTLAGHPQHGQCITNTILVIPQLIGSSSSSAVILELFYTHKAPRALLLGARDAILPIGAITARQMGWAHIPVLVLPDPDLWSGDWVSIDTDGMITKH